MSGDWPSRKRPPNRAHQSGQCQRRGNSGGAGRALTYEKTKQTRLRDRLATADLRLSVKLDATTATSCDAVQATTSPGGMVYDARRTQLDPAHAERIIGITGDGDQGLIALQACQAYVRKSSALDLGGGEFERWLLRRSAIVGLDE